MLYTGVVKTNLHYIIKNDKICLHLTGHAMKYTQTGDIPNRYAVQWDILSTTSITDVAHRLLAIHDDYLRSVESEYLNIESATSLIMREVYTCAQQLDKNCTIADIELIYGLLDHISDAICSLDSEAEETTVFSHFLRGAPRDILNTVAASENTELQQHLFLVNESMLDAETYRERSEAVIMRGRLLGYQDAIDYAVAYCSDPDLDNVLLEHDINILHDLSFVLDDYPHSKGNGADDAKYDFAWRYVSELLNMPTYSALKILQARTNAYSKRNRNCEFRYI